MRQLCGYRIEHSKGLCGIITWAQDTSHRDATASAKAVAFWFDGCAKHGGRLPDQCVRGLESAARVAKLDVPSEGKPKWPPQDVTSPRLTNIIS